jgi:hypothetical protein
MKVNKGGRGVNKGGSGVNWERRGQSGEGGAGHTVRGVGDE